MVDAMKWKVLEWWGYTSLQFDKNEINYFQMKTASSTQDVELKTSFQTVPFHYNLNDSWKLKQLISCSTLASNYHFKLFHFITYLIILVVPNSPISHVEHINLKLPGRTYYLVNLILPFQNFFLYHLQHNSLKLLGETHYYFPN